MIFIGQNWDKFIEIFKGWNIFVYIKKMNFLKQKKMSFSNITLQNLWAILWIHELSIMWGLYYKEADLTRCHDSYLRWGLD